MLVKPTLAHRQYTGPGGTPLGERAVPRVKQDPVPHPTRHLSTPRPQITLVLAPLTPQGTTLR